MFYYYQIYVLKSAIISAAEPIDTTTPITPPPAPCPSTELT